jgi:hypothetical protein
MFFKIIILLLLSLLSSLSLSTTTSTSTSTSLSNNIDYTLLSSLNNKINDYKQHQHQHQHHPQHHHHHHPQQQHHHHQELIGDFILPIDLSSTLGMIITKNSDPFVIATESIGDNIKKVSSWEKVDNNKDKDLLYTRDISYIHNRKSSSSSSTSSLSSLLGPKATSHELIQLLQLNEKNFEDHHHHDYHAKLVGFMNLSHVPYCHNTSYITLWDFCSFRGRDDNRDFIMTHVKVSLTIDGLQPSMYKSIIKNSIITDLKQYVEEFRLASMNQLNHNHNNYNHLNNDEKVLLNIINNKKQPLNSKHISNNNKDIVVNNNKLDSNFWTLPTTSNDATMTIPAITLLSSYLLYYKQKLKGILINPLISSSSSSSSSTTSSSLSSLLKKNNIISKLRTSFGQLIMKKNLMKNINIRKIF